MSSLDPNAGPSGSGSCRKCGDSLEVAQTYCLSCGHRAAGPRVPSGPVLEAIAIASLAAVANGGRPPEPVTEPEPAESKPDDSVAGAAPAAAGLGTLFASKSAGSTGLALLIVGMVAGAAFSPPAPNSLAARQVVIVQSAGDPATGPAAEPAADPGLLAEVPTDELPAFTDPGVTTPAVPVPVDPPAVPTEPTIGHLAFVLLPGGATGQTFVPSATAARRSAHSAADPTWASVTATAAKSGFLAKGFKQISTSPFANGMALLSGIEPTADMEAGCTGTPPQIEEGKGCLVADPGPDNPGEVATLIKKWISENTPESTPRLAQAIRVYVETPEKDPADYSHLCSVPKPGEGLSSLPGATPSLSANPILWFRSITGEPVAEPSGSPLCAVPSQEGIIRPLSALEDDLRHASAEDGERVDPSLPSAFPKLTLIIPSPCRTDSSVSCPDGTTEGGPAALADFLRVTVAETLAQSDIFTKDGAAVTVWDRPPGSSNVATGALINSNFVNSGKSNTKAYDTYGLLATIEERFSLAGGPGAPPPLGKSDGAKTFGREIFPAR